MVPHIYSYLTQEYFHDRMHSFPAGRSIRGSNGPAMVIYKPYAQDISSWHTSTTENVAYVRATARSHTTYTSVHSTATVLTVVFTFIIKSRFPRRLSIAQIIYIYIYVCVCIYAEYNIASYTI